MWTLFLHCLFKTEVDGHYISSTIFLMHPSLMPMTVLSMPGCAARLPWQDVDDWWAQHEKGLNIWLNGSKKICCNSLLLTRAMHIYDTIYRIEIQCSYRCQFGLNQLITFLNTQYLYQAEKCSAVSNILIHNWLITDRHNPYSRQCFPFLSVTACHCLICLNTISKIGTNYLH